MINRPYDTDVLVVGAGPVGLTLALDLTRRGVRVRLVDRAPGTFPGSRAKGIQPRTLEVFDDLGVADEAFAAGGDYPHWARTSAAKAKAEGEVVAAQSTD